MQIYERIQKLRKEILKLTQEDFAQTIKISRSNLANIEIGKVNVTERVISEIVEKYSVSENWLKMGQGDIFTRTEETFLNELAAKYPEECDGLLKRIVSLYIKLNSDERAAIQKYIDQLSTPPPEPEEDSRAVYIAASSENDKPDEITRMTKRELAEIESAPDVENDEEI